MAARHSKGIQKRLTAILDEQRDRSPSTGRSRYIVPSLWLAGTALLASLSACRTSPPSPAISKPNTTTTPTSRVQVTLMAFETEDPRRFKNFMPADTSLTGVVEVTGIINKQAVDILLADYKSDSKIDLLASHSVVTPLGKSGRIDQITEFIYPTEYSPPEIPNSKGKVGEQGGEIFPVTPATPTSFETKNLGVMFEATPKRKDDFIELTCNLTHTHFLGFVNYGSPINAPATDFLGFPVEVVITENRTEMPVFNSKRTKTTITISPGQTVVLAGPASAPNPNLNKRLVPPKGSPKSNLGKPKTTLYFITPEFVKSE